MEIKEAVDKLREELKADKGYYLGWKANIAVQFQDECARAGIKFPQLWEISNKAAENFLDLLLKDSK